MSHYEIAASYGDFTDDTELTVPLPDKTSQLVAYYLIQAIALSLYLLVSVMWVFNGVNYLVLKRRYKEFSIALFYSSTVALMGVRIYQHVHKLTVVVDHTVAVLVLVADVCSVIIGLSQITLISDILIALQSFKVQCLRTGGSETERYMSAEICLRLEREARTKTKTIHVVIGGITLLLIAELVIRHYIASTYYYDFIFSIELVAIGVILFI